MKGKIVISVISVVLVVGVVVAVVGVVNNNKPSKGGDNAATASMKMVTSICEGTSFKEMCARSLESAARNSSATAKDYLLSALHYTVEEVKKGLDATRKVESDAAVDSCKNFLDTALISLNDTITSVMDSTTHTTLEERAHELLSWVTGVHAMHTTCLDFIPNPDIKSAIHNGINNATQLAHNAVNIIADLPQVLPLFGLSDNDESSPSPSPSPSPSRRRLLLTDDGFPTWFSASDRKLLEKHGKAHKNKNKNSNGSGQDNSVNYVANIVNIKPNVVVAQDGSGDFKTIGQAIAAYPANLNGRFIIYVKAGVYKEYVTIDYTKPNIFMYGDGIGKTIITGNKCFTHGNLPPILSATFSNEAFGFIARGMTFRNEAGPEGHQAVAFRNKGDKVAVFDCSFEGYQDTLYYQFLRQFYRNCVIYGTIDFIFGKGDAVIQDSEIIVRKPMPNQFNAVTADGREIEKGSNGLVLHNCRIRPDNYLYPARFQIPTYLGRPWTAKALTVFMQCELADFIRPEGYKIWNDKNPEDPPNHKTCEYLEVENRGPGNKTERRDYKLFRQSRVISTQEAVKYTSGQFIMGENWLPHTGLPYRLGF